MRGGKLTGKTKHVYLEIEIDTLKKLEKIKNKLNFDYGVFVSRSFIVNTILKRCEDTEKIVKQDLGLNKK